MKPTVMLVGHGVVSGKRQTVDYKNYSLIFPVPNKEPFSLSSHNMIVKLLTDASDEENITKVVELLVSLPTTIKVTASHYKDIKLTVALGISLAKERAKIHEQLLEAEKESISSTKAWELLEYKISPAQDVLSSVFSFLPTKNIDFAMFPLMHRAFIDNNSATLNIYLNNKRVLEQTSKLLTGGNKYELSGDNFVYMTPMANTAGDASVMLSNVLVAIENVCILVAKYAISSIASDAKRQKSDGISVEMVFLEDFKDHKSFADYKTGFESSHTSTEWFEFCLPNDCNVIIGACGGEDFSF